MKKSIILLAAMASLMAGCLSDDYPEEVNHTDRMVSFSGKRPSYSRADKVGKDAADELGDSFLVYGFKGDGSFAAGNTQEVFDYYLVNYSEGSDYTTTTNTDGWEYVGTPVINSLVADIAKDGTQTPKYWDYGQAQYGFVAFSKGTNTGNIEDYITDAKIDYTKISSPVDPVYTLKGDADKLKNFFVSDLHIVEKENYGQPVKLNFRTNGAKVRIGIYETIPGYSVKNVTFKQSTSNDEYAANPALTSNATEIMYGKGAGTLGVFFPGSDTKPHFKFTTTEEEGNYTHELTFGNLSTTGKEKYEADGNYLYRTSSNPSYTNYVTLMPAGTTQNLQLTAKYTLVSLDGRGETIDVGPIAVSVPAQYANWLPNFAYTYLFKITDVGSGLYPITFDAAEIVDAGVDLDAESTINRPAINAYQEGVTIGIGNNKIYTSGDIFVTVHDLEGNIVSPLKVGIDYADGANINLFKIVMSNSVNPSDVTEPLLAQCFNAQYPTVDTYTYNFDSNQDKIIMMKRVNENDGDEHFTGGLKIPADQSQYGSHNETVAGAKFTASDNTMYAIQYRDPNGNYVYKIITIGSPEQYYMMNYTAIAEGDIWYYDDNENGGVFDNIEGLSSYDSFWFDLSNELNRAIYVENPQASWGNGVSLDENSTVNSVTMGDEIQGCLVFDGPVTEINYAFYEDYPLKSISLPPTLTKIGNFAFEYTSLENVVMPSGIKSIGDYAYSSCQELKYLTLNEGLETIGNFAFNYNTSLKKLVCPSTLTDIGGSAFSACEGMTTLYLNEGLETIGDHAFDGIGVKSLKIPQTVKTICSFSDNSNIVQGFANCPNLVYLQLPAYCGNYGPKAFYGNEMLTTVTLDSKGTYLRGTEARWGNYIFATCTHLTNVSIPSNVVELGKGAFSGCSSLVTIKLNNNIATMGGYVFQYCDKLKNVNIPTSLSKIESNMFDGCKSLETITIPANITSISDKVFLNCEALKTVIFEGTTPPAINPEAFAQSSDKEGNNITHYYPSGLKIYVPDDAVETYQNKFKKVLPAFESMIYSINDLNE